MTKLYQKLLNIQKEIGAITKDSTNPFFKSKYFDINGLLAELKPVLNKEGVVVLQPLVAIDGKSCLETMVIDVESGEVSKSQCILPENSDPQKMGSIITYFRRYSLQSLFLLQAEDDDANVASQAEKAFAKPASDVPFPSNTKVEGAFCAQCADGKIVKNPATGKLFCDKKCWLIK